MEVKCVQANNYEEALEKLNRGEFYEPETKADYEIRIKGDSIEVKNKDGEFVVLDYDGDVVSAFEKALEDLEPELNDDLYALLQMMSDLGYDRFQYCDCGTEPELEFYGDNKYANINIYPILLPKWMEAHEDYKIKELLEKY